MCLSLWLYNSACLISYCLFGSMCVYVCVYFIVSISMESMWISTFAVVFPFHKQPTTFNYLQHFCSFQTMFLVHFSISLFFSVSVYTYKQAFSVFLFFSFFFFFFLIIFIIIPVLPNFLFWEFAIPYNQRILRLT